MDVRAQALHPTSCSANPSLRGKNSLGSKPSLAAAYYSRLSQKKKILVTPTPPRLRRRLAQARLSTNYSLSLECVQVHGPAMLEKLEAPTPRDVAMPITVVAFRSGRRHFRATELQFRGYSDLKFGRSEMATTAPKGDDRSEKRRRPFGKATTVYETEICFAASLFWPISTLSSRLLKPAGVPQGGLLSPLLFVICINSLDASIPASVAPVKYADDLTTSEALMGSLPGQTQKALNSIDDWGRSFSLAANGKKTKDMVISARKEPNVPIPPQPTISGQVIERVTSFKLLGVYIAADLTWDAHIEYMMNRARPRMYYLSVAKKAGLPIDVLMQIYLTFIRPILEYASPVWGGLPKHLSDSLESIQKRCLRIIGLPADALPTLANRRERATLRTIEKYPKGQYFSPLGIHHYPLGQSLQPPQGKSASVNEK
ncbi:hypothetical protein Bbelb_410240 [Branchiostoma belcheri]|nr:hypothetical protein Bbelb_410240 [Branchiostoma belcheri]